MLAVCLVGLFSISVATTSARALETESMSRAAHVPTYDTRTKTDAFSMALSSRVAPILREGIPQIQGLTAQSQFDAGGRLVAVRYLNSAGTCVATFAPEDKAHNNGVTWHWDVMTDSEREQALRWLFDPQQMLYSRFEGREAWLMDALTQWIPRLAGISQTADPAVLAHWQTDGADLTCLTFYEALSRLQALTAVRERRTCSYGYSDRGLIEYGGEMIFFTEPAWQKLSLESRQILTVVWTIKEAMVIYYPQSLGWTSPCLSERTHLKTEYYSTIWLLQAERTLAQYVPADRSYWEEKEIPFQIRNIVTQSFPPCLPPATSYAPTPCFESSVTVDESR
jgi:hypothetical protein